ncbi:MAG: serine/threonine protein kinase [Planctomycetes bacterium]|nr:serine/threonine protein kinase [Planctomycetota bacterium]
MADPLLNAMVGPYVLREMISAGGIAEVYRAQHREDGRSYAVKVIRPERQADKLHAKAFREEFALLQRLAHPSIPKARRFDTVAGRACMVMDLIPGTTIHQMRADRASFDALEAFTKLTASVAYLHANDVVHNDLKLENVILRPDGSIGLVDFGNARVINRTGLFHRLLKRRPPVFGTPTYIAPELIAGEGRPTCQSDLYSLGVCCFIMLTGLPPFTHDRKSGRLRAAVSETAPSIRSRVPSLSPAFARLIDLCLAKDPTQRLDNAGHLQHAIKASLKSAGSGTAGIEPIEV